MQATVGEVDEGVDFDLQVLLGSSVHLLQFFNWKARSAHFCRIEIADFCFKLRGDISFQGVRCGGGRSSCGHLRG